MTDPLVQERMRKRDEILEMGIPPYATKYSPNTTCLEILDSKEFQTVEQIQENPKDESSVAGRLMTFREHGKLSFGTIQDNSGKIQLCFLRGFTRIHGIQDDDEKVHEKFWKKSLDMGDYLGVKGDLFTTKHGEITLLVHELTLLTKSLRPLPEKWHGLSSREACYRERNLDLISNPETQNRFKKRSAIVREMRSFFYEKGFEEVETNVLQSQAGGAMAKVFETHHNALDHDFVLRIALELPLKIACSGGFDRIFEMGKNFRNEGSDPSHLQEFTMLEWYAAYENLETNKKWMQEMLQRICKNVMEKTTFQILDTDEKVVEVDFLEDFHEVTFAELLQQYAKIDMFDISDTELRATAKELGIEDFEKMGRGNLLDDIYKKTARPHLIQPTFVTNWPSDLKPLANPNGDGTSDVYQLLVAGWEIINAYGELTDPVIQRQLLEDQQKAKSAGDNEAMELDEVFLKAMEHGFPPMTGVGIGIDRLCALLCGVPNLRDVVLFPTMKPETKALSQKEAEVMYRSKKIIVIANEMLGHGVAANAIGQLGISIGGHSKEKMFEAKILPDADGNIHHTDSLYPMANLSGTQEQMAEFAQKCFDANIQFFDFSDIMRKAHTDKQMKEGYCVKKTKDVGYIAVGALVPEKFEKKFLSELKLFGSLNPVESDEQKTRGDFPPDKGGLRGVVLKAEGRKPESLNAEKMVLSDSAKKFVAVLNKKVEHGKLMNALGHMSAGISSDDSSNKNFLEYKDGNDGVHPNISHFPFIILRADNSNKLRTLRKAAQELKIECTDFTSTMTVGTSADQIEATKNTNEEDLEYYGVCLFGNAEKIDPLTKKFSLWR